MLRDLVTLETERILKSNHNLVARLVSERKRFENWLLLEIFKALIPDNPSVEVEKPLLDGKERCDLWANEGGGKESWLELKLCVTNYCSDYTESQSTRPITNQISDVVRDVEKLSSISDIHNRNVLLIAYPLPFDYRTHSTWANHINRMKTSASKLEEMFSVTIERKAKSTAIVGYLLGI